MARTQRPGRPIARDWRKAARIAQGAESPDSVIFQEMFSGVAKRRRPQRVIPPSPRVHAERPRPCTPAPGRCPAMRGYRAARSASISPAAALAPPRAIRSRIPTSMPTDASPAPGSTAWITRASSWRAFCFRYALPHPGRPLRHSHELMRGRASAAGPHTRRSRTAIAGSIGVHLANP